MKCHMNAFSNVHIIAHKDILYYNVYYIYSIITNIVCMCSGNSHPSSVVLMTETEGLGPASPRARTENWYVVPDSSPST